MSEQGTTSEFDEFPEAAPFADLIVGEDPAERRWVAEVLHDRISAIRGETARAPSAEEDRQRAIEEKDMGAYIDAARRLALEAEGR